MAEPSALSIVTFARSTFNRSVSTLKQAAEGLSQEQLIWQPSSDCNSMAWLAWHLSRRKDYYTSKLAGEEQEWVSGGWFERFGLSREETGTGHTLTEVAAFKHPFDLVTAYVEAANQAALRRIDTVSESDMATLVELDAGRGMRPKSDLWNPMLSDCLQHLGQISYIRGLITGKGWFAV